ncbi:MAG TPA: hypothetical protein VIL58_01240, partial [Thermoplasmata archaeon]
LYALSPVLVSPELAALFMATSSVSVTMNTLLLKRFRPSMLKRKPRSGKAPRAVPFKLPATAAGGNPGGDGA